MGTLLFPKQDMQFLDHPRFHGVRMAVLVTGLESDAASICLLAVAPGVEIPAHAHDPHIDSILVLEGAGEALVNGAWQAITAGDYLFVPPRTEHAIRNRGLVPLLLFVHHSPPLL